MAIELLRTGKWASDLATAKEMTEKVQELRAYVIKYNWGEDSIHPYGFPVKINEFLGWFKDYEQCTHSSKQLHLSEINGFIKIINSWIRTEEEPKVRIRLLTGNHKGEIKEIPQSFVEDYIDCGIAALVKEGE